MRALTFAAGLIAGLALMVPAARAGDFTADLAAAESASVGGRPPVASVSAYRVLAHRWTILEIFVIWDPPRAAGGRSTPHWAVRRAVGGMTEPQPAKVDWALSDSCPAMEAGLRALEALETPRPSIPGLDERNSLGIVADGVGYHLRVRHALYASNEAFAGLEISGNVNTPLAAWTEDFLTSLNGCWRDEAPVP